MITLTESAKEKALKLFSESNLDPTESFIRVGVKGGGCSGYKYNFTTDMKVNEDDLVFENVLIDKSSFALIEGSILDFSEKLIENTFKIINPKATSSCGCGSSFAI